MNNMLIILGAMKCGTTSLFNYLSEHPEIRPCPSKEPDFFSKDGEWEKGIDYYDALWKNQLNNHYKLESSVSYSKRHLYPETSKRMKSSRRSFKFIYIVRDPIERIESHYTHGISDKWEIAKPTIELVDKHAIETTKYFFQLQPYIENFGSENILILDFLSLKHKPSNLVNKIYRFLDIPSVEISKKQYSAYNKSDEKVAFSAVGFWLVKINYRINLSGIMPTTIKRFLKNLFSSPLKRYKLSETQKTYVLNKLNDDFKKFNHLIGDRLAIKEWPYYKKSIDPKTSNFKINC